MKVPKFIPLALIIFFIGASLTPGAFRSQASALPQKSDLPGGMPTDQLIIKYQDNARVDFAGPDRASEMERLSSVGGVELAYFRPMSGDAHVLKLPATLPERQVAAVAARLSSLPEVEYAEPDAIMLPLDTNPNDPSFPSQWHYMAPTSGNYGINAPAAWDVITGTVSVVAAVIDTGILNHADLAGRTVAGYDFITDSTVANDGDGRDADPSDPGDWTAPNECYFGWPGYNSSWHGTHVAGTIGAATNNSLGVAGINWNSKILPLRVLGKCGGSLSDIAQAMRWAAGLAVAGVPANANPAKVLNLSLGGTGTCGSTYQNAIDAIVAAGSTVVVAAGNSNVNASNFRPANCNSVITVAATDRYGDRAYYSNFGSIVEISAPGGDTQTFAETDGVLSTLNTGTTVPVADSYKYYQGTSMATPHVVGVASLLYSLDPSLTPVQVGFILTDTVTLFPPGSDCTTSLCGTGILNAANAVNSIGLLKVYLPIVLKNFSAIPPAAPTNLNATTLSHNQIQLTWTDNADNESGFSIERSPNGSTGWAEIATVAANVTNYNNTGLTPNTTYYYRVRAYNGIGPSAYSNVDSATTDPAPVQPICNGDFELGKTCWTEFSTHGYDLIINSGFPGSVTPRSGSWAVWLGGDDLETSYIQQQVSLPAGTPSLVYWHWIASQDACGFDFAYVKVNGSTVHTYQLCSINDTGGWAQKTVNLSAYAGQTVTLRIETVTDAILNSNLFVDDVSIQATLLTSDSTASDLAASELAASGFNPAFASPKPQSLAPGNK